MRLEKLQAFKRDHGNGQFSTKGIQSIITMSNLSTKSRFRLAAILANNSGEIRVVMFLY